MKYDLKKIAEMYTKQTPEKGELGRHLEVVLRCSKYEVEKSVFQLRVDV